MNLKLFADDTNVFIIAETYAKLEKQSNLALDLINKWLKCNKLTLNTNKTHYIIFSKRKINQNLHLYIENETIERVDNTKFLGIYIHENLQWNKHFSVINQKMRKFIHLFYNIRNYTKKKTMIMLYNSLVLPIYNYGIELIGKAPLTLINRIQTTQNTILKIILRKDIRTSSKEIHKKTNILKIADHYTLRLLLKMHSIIHYPENLPYEYKCLNFKKNDYCSNLRNKDKIPVKQEMFEYKNKVIDNCILQWNKLKKESKLIKSRTIFKSTIIKSLEN